MQCAGCGFDNPLENKFCGGCGKPLEANCGQCGHGNPAGFAFCGQCGAALGEASPTGPGGAPSPKRGVADSAERRHLTILFCDLVDSTPLADRLDPEDLRDLVLQYQATAAGAIERYEGHIAQYLGDGLLVYFGYPVAHEDDARRALYSGLEILEAMRDLAGRVSARWGVDLAVRIGIHSGSTVTGQVGTSGRSERLAVGQAPNIAARLQSIADRNEMVISQHTADIVGDAFVLEDRGTQTLKGVAEPMGIWRVVGETDVRERFQALTAAASKPFVGRSDETAMILGAAKRTAQGSGEMVMITGEPGMGKSRLLEHARSLLGARVNWITLSCSPYHSNAPLYPVASHFSRLFGLSVTDDAAVRLAKVETYLNQTWVDRASIVPFLAGMLSLQPGSDYPRLPPSAKQAREGTFAVAEMLLFGNLEQEASVLLVEDLHWADPSTLEFLDALVMNLPTRPVLLLVTSRDATDQWEPLAHASSLQLQPLAASDVGQMVTNLLGEARLPDAVRAEIERRTDGVPIFVEELTKMMRGQAGETGKRGSPTPSIPVTLRDSLTARLDGLGEARETLQMASVLGREFSYNLLNDIAPERDTVLAGHLRQLMRDNLLESVPDAAQTRFRFRHALIQDAAYDTMLRTRRVQLHATVAEALSTHFVDLVERRPDLLAHHLTMAHEHDRAVAFWMQAGQAAMRRGASAEAQNLFERGLALIDEDSEEAALRAIEERMQVGLGSAIANATNWGNVRVTQAFERAEALSRKLGDDAGLFRCKVILRMNATSQARHEDAASEAAAALELAMQANEAHLLAQAHAASVHPSWHLGRFAQAVSHGDAGLAAVNNLPEGRFAAEQRLYLYAYMLQALWVSGDIPRTRELLADGIALAGEVSDPYAASFFLVWGATPLMYLNDDTRFAQVLHQGRAIGEEHGFNSIRDWADIQLHWLQAKGGDEAVVDLLERAIESYIAQGAGADRPFCYLLLGEAQLFAGRYEQALATLDLAQKRVEGGQEVCHYSEILRASGEVLVALGRREAAEQAFRHAVEVALAQQASGWQLRSTTAAARAWVNISGDASGRDWVSDNLALALRSFAGAQTTPDLQEADGLLKQLVSTQG